MDCSNLNEIFNCDGPEWIDVDDTPIISPVWNRLGEKHTEETKELIRQSNKGISQATRDGHKKRREENPWPIWNKGLKGAGKGLGVKKVEYRGKVFSSMTAAAKHFNVTVSAVSQWGKRL